MYAVVEYNNYRKEQFFKVILTTEDVEYAKRVAFHYAKKEIKEDKKDCYKITTEISECYLYPENKCIVQYTMIRVKPIQIRKETAYKIQATYSTVHAVIQIDPPPVLDDIHIPEIDTNLLCENPYSYDYPSDEGEEEEV